MTTAREELHWAKTLLKDSSESPHLDAEILLSHVLQQSRTQLLTHTEKKLTTEQITEFRNLVDRRQKGEPIAYLRGYQDFWSLSLKVSPATLIPRPETELLVEHCLEKLESTREQTILDLGTGSGAIALAIAKERPHWKIIASDFSSEALRVAQENAGDDSSVQFILSDWFEKIPHQHFDAIISNPPYIAENDPHLEHLNYEPTTALTAKENGLADLHHLIERAIPYLKPSGYLFLEHGFDQSDAVKLKMKEAGYQNIEQQKDFNEHLRITFGKITP